ncbi:MAG: SDR family oxidoreductase [Kineosporiaceae bacterium]|nr:SDR family oxidoreductase [Aeromicrobium sp.]
MKIVLTGAGGFLGWHLRCRLRALHDFEVVAIDRSTIDQLPAAMHDADAVIHVAGVNRASDEEVVAGNVALAQAVANAIRDAGSTPHVVFANSIQAGNGTPYGEGKKAAAAILWQLAKDSGLEFVDVHLPNLFGEHGRPGYNSFIATFCHELAAGRAPEANDNVVELLHVQEAAQILIKALEGPSRIEKPRGEQHHVQAVLTLLQTFEELYRNGEIPDLSSTFATNLFNTYRAAAFELRGSISFDKRSDPRGSLVEAVKVHGGGGQTFFSTTVPGVTRGEHFHLRKIERFIVIGGTARIQLRKLFTDEIMNFDVTGDEPTAIDMPTMWTHNITNTGDRELLTLFWTDSVFDPADPDTYAETVEATQ